MSLAHFLLAFLWFQISSLALAGQCSSTTLSPYLNSVIPSCAQGCVENFIAVSFPESTQQDLTCLCTSNSSNGFTLGEGALRCVASDCTGDQPPELTRAYEICAKVSNAEPMTHVTITATMQVATTISLGSLTDGTTIFFSTASSLLPQGSSLPAHRSSSITSASISLSTKALATATRTPLVISHTSVVSALPSSASSASSTFTAIPVTSSTSTPKAILTKPQIAGVAVAGVACASIAFGVLFYIFCFRRKKRDNKRDSGSSFGDDHIVDIPHNPPGDLILPWNDSQYKSGPSVFMPSKAQALLGVPGRTNDRGFGLWRRSVKPEEIGVAVAPEMVHDITHDDSPISAASYMTTSQLLPEKPLYEKPHYTLYPPPLRPKPSLGPDSTLRLLPEDSVYSGPVLVSPPKPAHRAPESLIAAQADVQRRLNHMSPSSTDPFIDRSVDPRVLMYAMERRRASRPQLPRIIPPAPRNAQRNSWRPAPSSTKLIQPAELEAPTFEVGGNLAQLRSELRLMNPSVESSHTSFASTNPRISTQTVTRKPVPERRKSSGRRPLTHLTTHSDTSFEDDQDEVDELPARESTLSPVVESPRLRTPLGKIRYPPIPGTTESPRKRRPSPESPTRKPQGKRPLEASTIQFLSQIEGPGQEQSRRPHPPDHSASLLVNRSRPSRSRPLGI
ncbi:hypothetical protein MMC06_006333 [Schaereria dolodes]|nr:hypothetical protein [Schaereria dolodes]